jgi:hypothetical protein
MRSPLTELYAKFVIVFGVTGLLASVFFHPGMLCITFLILVITLSFYASMERGAVDRMRLDQKVSTIRRRCCNPPRKRKRSCK